MDFPNENYWKENFLQQNFNVDQCLSKYTLKSDLEVVRSNLKNYGNELHQQMADILKTETEAIVNLAEYLTNLSSKIDDLALPISQLREEIKTLFNLIKNAQESYYNTLESIKLNNNKRNYLNLKLGIISSALYIDDMIRNQDDLFKNSVVLERAVLKFTFEYNYLDGIELNADLEEIKSVAKTLTKMVNKIFLKSVEHDEADVILRCLRMYENLGEQREAEQIYQVNVVRPALKPLFTESHLEACNQEIATIHSEVLQFIDSKLVSVQNTIEENSELKSFNFILNSFWVEVDKLSREGLPYITAPGNPELFQKRFKSTWNFLKQIAEKCGNYNLLFTNKSFRDHIKRFNLAVYFEIRFQQIAGQFESSAIIKPGVGAYLGQNDINCNLRVTLALWKALLTSFNSDVFIDNLADQFLKLSMLLLARYLKWFETALEGSDLFTEGSSSWEDFIINSINDLNIVKKFVTTNTGAKSVFSTIPTIVQPFVLKICTMNLNAINGVVRKLQNNLVTIKSNESLGHLQNVTAIPRLYRRTNRSVPKDASNYMVEATRPIVEFNKKFKPTMQELQFILDNIVSNNTKQYLHLVEDVLRSVCKTEESLRRLKHRNLQIPESAPEEGENTDIMSDEMKIREQIKLDVRYFIDKLYGITSDEVKKSMDELKKQIC